VKSERGRQLGRGSVPTARGGGTSRFFGTGGNHNVGSFPNPREKKGVKRGAREKSKRKVLFGKQGEQEKDALEI